MKFTSLTAAIAILAGIAAPALAERGPDMPTEITREQALQRASDRFDAADADGNGVLTRAEMKAAFEKERGKRDKPRGGEIFSRIDTDGDGALSRDEFRDSLAKFAERRKGDHGDRKGDHGEKPQAHRGESGHGDKAPAHRGKPAPMDPDARADALFKRLDKNGDGALSPDELQSLREAHERGGSDHKPGKRPEPRHEID